MEWLHRMNAAIDYVEANLAGEIDTTVVAREACCSEYHFIRMFSFITEITLSEYIRLRRMTLAGFELKNSDIKIIDLANKYGYDSPSSFARAFQAVHGVVPSAARRLGVELTSFARIFSHHNHGRCWIELSNCRRGCLYSIWCHWLPRERILFKPYQLSGTSVRRNMASGPRQERCYWRDDGKMIVEAWVPVVKP